MKTAVAFAAALAGLLGTSDLLADWPEAFRQDANLYDVCFVDRLTGWAVGDRGTILKTSDGGGQWHVKLSEVDCRLESIHFVDTHHGWAVGGHSVPYTHRAKGVVLQTRDGGERWELMQGHFLPWLKHVQFLNAEEGYAVGLTTAMFPSAIFRTRDGGKHWTPWPGTTVGCVHAQFGERNQGLVLERDGRITRVEASRLKPSNLSGEASPKRLHRITSAEALAVGHRGYVGWTYDGGNIWATPESLKTHTWRSQFDWSAIGGYEQHIWIAGIPGTRVLHSADRGVSWQTHDTGQGLPLFALDFVDAQHGWAVGAMGTILATTDGGQTWRPQTDVPRRVAICAVASQTSAVPWELLAQASAGDGFLSSVEVLSGPPSADHASGTVPLSMRLQEGTSSLSGSLANMIQSLPTIDDHLGLSAMQIQQRWDQAMQGDCEDALAEYLVRQLRMLRPEMVVISDLEKSGASDFIDRLVRRAIEQAADAGAFPDQIRLARLHAWQVPRTARRTQSPADNTYRISPLRLALPVGRSVQNLSDHARSLVFPDRITGPDELLFELSGVPQVSRRNRRETTRLFDLASLARGDKMHRTDLSLQGDFRQLHRHAQRRRTIESLLLSTNELSAVQLQQVSALAHGLPASDRGALLYQTAKKLAATSHQAESYALLDELTSQLPKHALSEAARIQLFAMTASREGLVHWRLPEEHAVNHIASGVEPGKTTDGVRPATFEVPDARGRPLSAEAEIPSARLQQRQLRAIKIAESIQANQPDLYFEPMLRFPLAALHWQMGRKDEAAAFWRGQMARQNDSYWTVRARNEMELLKPNPSHQTASHVCRLSQTRPRLDGQLDNETWVAAPAMILRADSMEDDELGTELKWAWDAEFLYIAGRCHFNRSAEPGSDADGPRQRDSDLTGFDRVEMRLDIDRDYVTHWHLVVDRRGWANDALNDDRSWDPTWYIATKSEESSWTFEAAIPWPQICPTPPGPRDAWAVRVNRYFPGVGSQSWWHPTSTAAEQRTDTGMLVFD